MLRQKTSELSSALKSYRNLIHPGRAKRLDDKADQEGAVVAHALVKLIVREVAETQARTYGLTAEQILNKFETDPTAIGIADHLLKGAPENELQRLMVSVLPGHYFAELTEEVIDNALLSSHSKLFRAAFRLAAEPTKRTVMKRHVEVLKEAGGETVQVYEDRFFQAEHINHVEEDDRDIVKAHLFARMNDEPNLELFDAAQGIGAHLEAADVHKFVDPLVRASLRQDQALADAAAALFDSEALETPAELDQKIVDRFLAWETTFQGRGNDPAVARVKEFRGFFEFFIAEDDAREPVDSAAEAPAGGEQDSAN